MLRDWGRSLLEVPAEVAPRAVIHLIISRLRAQVALAEVAHGVEELLGDHAADEARYQAAKDSAGHHTAHAHSRTAEGALHHSRPAHLGPRREPRQGPRVITTLR